MTHNLACLAGWMLLGCLLASACPAQDPGLDPRNGLSELTQARAHRVVPDEGQLRLASLPEAAGNGGLPQYSSGLTTNRDWAALQKGVKFLVKNVARNGFGRSSRPGIAPEPDLDPSTTSAAVVR